MADTIRRRRQKETEYLRSVGRSVLVPAGPSIARVRYLHDQRGMTLLAIAEAAGRSLGAISDLYRGTRPKGPKGDFRTQRTTEEALKAITPPAAKVNTTAPLPWANRGAKLPVHGVRRRLNALAHEGFPMEWVNDNYIRIHKHSIWMLFMASVKRVYIQSAINERVKVAYEELDGKTPNDFDIPAETQRRVKANAARRNAAPRHCWDDDTLDDPDAIAEWTGHCGTQQGYYIHERDGQPKFWAPYGEDRKSGRFVVGCEPCRKARKRGQ